MIQNPNSSELEGNGATDLLRLLRLDAKARIQIGLIKPTPLAAEIRACRGLGRRRINIESLETDFRYQRTTRTNSTTYCRGHEVAQ